MTSEPPVRDPAAPSAASETRDPEEIWLRDVYRPDAPNLTVRAVLVGFLIGAVMCLSNLYVFFKTGWSMGVTLTACILAFAVFRGLSKLGARPLGVLENNALTTVASGAGYMTAGGNMAAYGALLMVLTPPAFAPEIWDSLESGFLLSREPQAGPSTFAMVLWFAVIATMGVFVAIPIKRQLINQEGLAFPTGTATAETIRSIHEAADRDSVVARTTAQPTLPVVPGARAVDTREGDTAGERETSARISHTPQKRSLSKVQSLTIGAAIGALVAALRSAFKILPESLTLPIDMFGHSLLSWTLAIKMEVVLIGAGALMSFRTGWSLLLGGLLTYGVLAPILADQGLITAVSYKGIVAWTLWPGAGILVGNGLMSFALDYKSLARSFSGFGAFFDRSKRGPATGIAAVEAPGWWFPAAFLVLGPIVILLMAWIFNIPMWAGVVAVFLAIFMGFIAARVTGETDVTPTKALGPVTQMAFGVMTPGNLTGNIMSANVTGGIGLHAADLLTTMKTGWLLGAKPRHQIYAQLFGVLAGAIVIVPAFNLIIPDKSVLGGDEWPAPSCLVWEGVSRAFANGLGALDSSVKWAIVIGLVIGVVLSIVEKVAPKGARAYIPSANGLGLSMVIPGWNSIAMFAGSAVAEILRRRQQDGHVVPVASGFIAGESLMGVVIALLVGAGILAK